MISNVGLMEVLARLLGTSRVRDEGDQVLDRNNGVWILMVVVAFLDIGRKEMMAKLVGRRLSWLSDGNG